MRFTDGMDKKMLALAVALVIFVSGCTNTGSQVEKPSPVSEASPGITVGNKAKDFPLQTIERETVRLSDLRGRYVLFASMATWCTPCQIEARNARAFQLENPGMLRVIQYGIDPRETNQDLQAFKNSFGGEDWIMGFDDGTITSLYNVRTFDTTIVVNPEGRIIYRDDGWPIDVATLKGLVK